MSGNHTIRSTDDDAIQLAHGLVRASPFATLATVSSDGFPLATLTSVATDLSGAPILLVSRLSGHTTNLLKDGRLSLLFARTGKGDPLAHPRISVIGRAEIVDRQGEEGQQVRRRFLARQPKAQLYVDFPDFLFIKVTVRQASLNGGFGKAYELSADELLTDVRGTADLSAAEADIINHMNADHADAVSHLATGIGRRDPGPWRMLSLDPGGSELAMGTDMVRIPFEGRVTTPDAARLELIRLAQRARAA